MFFTPHTNTFTASNPNHQRIWGCGCTQACRFGEKMQLLITSGNGSVSCHIVSIQHRCKLLKPFYSFSYISHNFLGR